MLTKSEYSFALAYYTQFHGNDLKWLWRQYMMSVWLHNKGNINGFNATRSVDKFNTLCNTDYDKLRDDVRLMMRRADYDTLELRYKWAQVSNEFLKKQGTRFMCMYGC